MADAMFLVLIILIMYILINETEDYLMLMMLGILFTFIGIAVITQTIAGSYDTLFTAAIPSTTPLLQNGGISAIFATIPLFAFAKVIIRRKQKHIMAKQIIPTDVD